ncbi:MAG TPA: hypothetical protein VNL37_03055 [Candidatus Polarisedimenticolia bacterium]|nr:hypothetical protein [Candidatus Polarisedimenticolia bacterium]
MLRPRSCAPWIAVALVLAGLCAACSRPKPQTLPRQILASLAPADQVVLLRVLEPEQAGRVALVVRPGGGKPELRLYGTRDGRPVLDYTARQGDEFINLMLEDVNGDGDPEILTTWSGGHLEILDVIGRSPQGAYGSLFQNAGRRIEQRHRPDGSLEFLITSRTYEETGTEPPTYETVPYVWDGHTFAEARAP